MADAVLVQAHHPWQPRPGLVLADAGQSIFAPEALTIGPQQDGVRLSAGDAPRKAGRPVRDQLRPGRLATEVALVAAAMRRLGTNATAAQASRPPPSRAPPA
jgi:hypothetical protein